MRAGVNPSVGSSGCAVDLGLRQVEWLWPGRVPLGMITMFAGDPKLGKSYVTLAMAAALSRDLPLPMGDLPNRRVAFEGSTILRREHAQPVCTVRTMVLPSWDNSVESF